MFFDRFPLADLRMAECPQIPLLDHEGPLLERLARAEAAWYERIPRAEVVIVLRIEPALFEQDRDMLPDLIAAAVNVALENAQRVVQEEMQKLGGPLVQGLGSLGGPGTGGA